jgi:hypothetical protein
VNSDTPAPIPALTHYQVKLVDLPGKQQRVPGQMASEAHDVGAVIPPQSSHVVNCAGA